LIFALFFLLIHRIGGSDGGGGGAGLRKGARVAGVWYIIKGMVRDKHQVISRLEENRERIGRLGVSRVGLFGSFVRGEQREDSDVDLLIEFEPERKTYRNLLDFAELVESILGREVEVLTDKGVSKYFRPYIEQEVEYVQID
jgi:hypothetical protein